MSSFELVNVGSGRLATDGECIRDAFVKINNNNSTIFNQFFDYYVIVYMLFIHNFFL